MNAFEILGRNFASKMDDATARRKAQMVEDRRKIEEAFPNILEQIVSPACEETKDAMEHIRKVDTHTHIYMFLFFEKKMFTETRLFAEGPHDTIFRFQVRLACVIMSTRHISCL